MKLGNRYKIAKRLGAQIFEKTQTQRFALSKERSEKNRKKGGRRNNSDYNRQLLEKQKLRITYCLTEKQFSNYVARALESSNPQSTLFTGLETRLDAIVYRLGMAPTRRAARQFVSHGHFLVNSKRTTVPSFRVHMGDVITVREGSKTSPMFENMSEKLKESRIPSWLKFDAGKLEGTLASAPAVSEQDSTADIGAVFEYYTR